MYSYVILVRSTCPTKIYICLLYTSDIESITITNEPISFKLRTNGIATDTKCIGNFKSDKYGKCRVYLYFDGEDDNPKYIVMKLKNNKFDYLIYNTKDDKQTEKVYSKLQKNLD